MRSLLLSILIASHLASPARGDVELKKRLTQQSETIKRQQDEIDQLKKLVAELTARVKKLEESSKTPPKAPQVDGKVTAVRKDLIEISAGSDDGLKAGMKFAVFRKQSFLARGTVLKTTADRSIARLQLVREQVRPGDLFTTRAIDK